MKEGLLWYDDNPKHNLAEKVGRAARRYRQKFGTPPDVCYVHPSALSDGQACLDGRQAGGSNGKVRKVGEVRVASLPSVLRHHFWVGREEERRRRRMAKSGKTRS